VEGTGDLVAAIGGSRPPRWRRSASRQERRGVSDP
jgi:hypothetical protein